MTLFGSNIYTTIARKSEVIWYKQGNWDHCPKRAEDNVQFVKKEARQRDRGTSVFKNT